MQEKKSYGVEKQTSRSYVMETYYTSIKNTAQLIVCRKIIHIYNKNYTKLTNHMKDINTLCKQNVEFLNVEISGT